MPRFSNYGPLDNPLIDEGDRGFVRMNARLRPDQLQPGELAMSQNGRMQIDGAWQPRKGINQYGPVLSTSTSSALLPFYAYANHVITALERVDAAVTITLANDANNILETAANSQHYVNTANLALPTGVYTASCYVKPNGRTRVSFGSDIEYNVGGDSSIPTSDFTLSGAGTVNLGSGTITALDDGWYRITATGSIYDNGSPGTVGITLAILSASGDSSYAGDITKGVYATDFQLEAGTVATRCEPTTTAIGNKNLLASSNDLTNATWWIKAETTIGADVEGYGRFVTGTQVSIDGLAATPTVDPEGNRTVTRVSGVSYTFTITGATGNETYTVDGSTVVGASILSGDTNKVYGSCLFSDPSSSNTEYILLAQNASCVAVNLSTAATTTIAYPAGITITAPVDMLQAFNKVGIFRDGLTALEWNGSLSGSPAFALTANGAYTQPAVLTTATNAACSAGVVTITNTHALAVGDIVEIMDNGSTGLVKGDKYVVTSISTTVSFTFYASVDDFTGQSVVLGVRQSVGRGYTHMPCPPWAIYHQRRLWMPFNYTTTGSSGTPTITSRNIRDEIIASDILDEDTYDQLENQFKIASGGADYIVAMQPFADDNILVFCRNSIHVITGVSGELEDTTVKEITREVGCLSRKSIAQIGNQIFFLSDNGVYSIDFGDLYNLRGATLPLSEAIQPIVRRINPAYADNSVGIYHDNRYWLFFPLDSAVLNNACIVYNILNQGWESLDLVNHDGWDVTNAIRAGAGGSNKLYTINTFGGIHIIDEREDDQDRLLLVPGLGTAPYQIEPQMVTRAFTGGSLDRKRYNAYEVNLESTAVNESDASIAFETENPDATTALDSIATSVGAAVPVSEDASVRGRIGNLRGYSGQLTVTPTRGRPKIRSIKVVSQLTDMPTSSKS